MKSVQFDLPNGIEQIPHCNHSLGVSRINGLWCSEDEIKIFKKSVLNNKDCPFPRAKHKIVTKLKNNMNSPPSSSTKMIKKEKNSPLLGKEKERKCLNVQSDAKFDVANLNPKFRRKLDQAIIQVLLEHETSIVNKYLDRHDSFMTEQIKALKANKRKNFS